MCVVLLCLCVWCVVYCRVLLALLLFSSCDMVAIVHVLLVCGLFCSAILWYGMLYSVCSFKGVLGCGVVLYFVIECVPFCFFYVMLLLCVGLVCCVSFCFVVCVGLGCV